MYQVTKQGVPVKWCATYAQANGYILEASGLGRVVDAADYRVQGLRVPLERILLQSDSAKIMGLGAVPRSVNSFREMGATIRDAFGWASTAGARVTVTAIWADGASRSVTLHNPERERGASYYRPQTIDIVAALRVPPTHEDTDVASDNGE